MSDVSFNVIGNRLILDNLTMLEETIVSKLDNNALPAAAAVGVDVAKSLARVDTGAMRDGINARIENHQIILGGDAPETIFNELGTIHMTAAPMLVPGAIAAGEELKKQLTGLI